MKNILFILLCFSFLYSQKDFYYGFINSNGEQIPQKQKQDIKDGFESLENIEKISKLGKLNEAFEQLKALKDKNKLEVLNGDIKLLYAKLALRKKRKKDIKEAAKDLEDDINASKISELDLVLAYNLLVDLKLALNKSKDAKRYANIIIENYDDELTKAYGKISLSKIYKYQKNYQKSVRILYEILTKTKDKQVATIVADELFDVYILQKDYKKANELISQILKNNIDYYVNDSYLAEEKISKLIKAGMLNQAVDILKELLNKAEKDEDIEDFKFKLANTYMQMYDKTNYYLQKSLDLYKEILDDYPLGVHSKKVKMYIDEILMRQGYLKPQLIAEKYSKSEQMQQKALLQELLNYKADKEYEIIRKNQKIYKKLSTKIVNRFGFKSIDEVLNEVDLDLIDKYLQEGKCFEFKKLIKNIDKNIVKTNIIDDISRKDRYFKCLLEEPNKQEFDEVRLLLKDTRDELDLLFLEKNSFLLNMYEDAFLYSQDIQKLKNNTILSKEMLYRYQILKILNKELELDKLYKMLENNPILIRKNLSNPVIIDFYYDYYLYLIGEKKLQKAKEVLEKLYNKQKEMKVYIYSPFIQLELSKYSNNEKKKIKYLEEALKQSRRIKVKDEARVYYELAKSYEKVGDKDSSDEYIQKCKDIKDTKENMYKNMCEKM